MMDKEIQKAMDKYEIKREIIYMGKTKLYRYYYVNDNVMDENEALENLVEVGNILFRLDKEGLLIPYIYNYSVSEDGKKKGIVIKKGTIIYDFIRFVKYNMRRLDITTHKYTNGNLYALQWEVTIKMISSIMNRDGKVHFAGASRQSGKSVIFSSKLSAFLTVFAAKYLKTINGTFDVVVGSYKKESIGKLFDAIRSEVNEVVDFYNLLYPKTPLFIGKDYKKNKNQTARTNSFNLEIGTKINGQILGWSKIYAISISAGMRSDGLTAELLVIDEMSLIKYSDQQKVEGFLSSTNGSTILTGIASNDPESTASHYNTLLNSNTSKSVTSYRIPFPVHYNMMKYQLPNKAELNLKEFKKKVESWGGIHSNAIQLHYLINFSAGAGSRFMTKSLLEKLDIRRLEYKPKDLLLKDDSYLRRVVSVDLATISDYCALTTLDVHIDGLTHNDELYNVEGGNEDQIDSMNFRYRDSVTFNESRNRIDFHRTAVQIAEYCKTVSADIIAVDATSSDVEVSIIHDEIMNLGITTLVLPVKLSGMVKQSMMMYFESMLKAKRVLLLKNDKSTFGSKKLIEELFYFEKNKTPSGKMEWRCPRGNMFTDDHLISTAIGVYALKFLIELQNKKRGEILIGIKVIDPADDKWVDVLDKFKDVVDDTIEEVSFLDFF